MNAVTTLPSHWESARNDAVLAALAAWRAIEHLYVDGMAFRDKPDGPVTEADRLADSTILEYLRERWGAQECGYLTEESEDNPTRLGKARIWIVDPIDGTRDFIRRNGNFAIHIALAEPDEEGNWRPAAAAVYLPIHGKMFSAVRGGGAQMQPVGGLAPEAAMAGEANEAAGDSIDKDVSLLGAPKKLRVSGRKDIGQLRATVGNANTTSRLMKLIGSLGLESHERMGSLGVKVCTIAGGEAELYVILARGKAKEWDLCAPHLILEEAGGRVSDLEGRPCRYNRPDARLWDGLLATNGPAHEALLAKIQAFILEHPNPFI